MRGPRSQGEEGVRRKPWAAFPNPMGFRWARSARPWVHLTRDDHASRAMFQALALTSIGSRNYRTHADATDALDFTRRRGRAADEFRVARRSEQAAVVAERAVEPLHQRLQVDALLLALRRVAARRL